jgi:rod shape-determining protein MreC
MQKRAGLLTIFFIVFILSIMLIYIFRQQVVPRTQNVVEQVTFPIQHSVYSAFGGALVRIGGDEKLRQQNRELASKIVDHDELSKEAKALRDQYDLEVVPTQNLLPAHVIGMKTFIPGVSLPEEIILDKGSNQRVELGQTVILTNNVVGTIKNVSEGRSLVTLISNREQSLTAKATKTDALGIIKGKGNGMLVLENVVLSDKLEKGDLVVTKGDQNITGAGFPPDLVIGKIASVDKKASDLFQTAEIESLIDFSRLSTVFIITNNK